MKKTFFACAVMVALFAETSAFADEIEPPAPRTKSYALQTLGADFGVALPLAIAGLATNSDALLGAAPIAFVFGAPIVHLAHGRSGVAAASFGVRTLVALGATGAYALVRSEKAECDQTGHCDAYVMALGGSALLAVGLPFATSVVDALVFAKEPARAAAFNPTITPRREGGVVVGIGGTF